VAAGRDYLDTLRSTPMASVVKMTIPVPPNLPSEWKELARGIAAKHNFNAEPHLTHEGLYVVLTTYADSSEIEDSAKTVRSEIEAALAQPSRVSSGANTSNVFINNGQAGAMGPNAAASGNTFQQLINVQPLAGEEQKQWLDQIERLISALKPAADEP